MNTTIVNLSNPGEPVSIGDRYQEIYENNTFKIYIKKAVVENEQEQPKPIRKIHKADFIQRMLPWWADIKTTRGADATVDGYFEMFNYFKFVDLDWPKTQFMIADLEMRIKEQVPETEFTAEAIMADGTEEEKYNG